MNKIRLEMCPQNMDAQTVAKFAQSKNNLFWWTKGNYTWSYKMIWIILELEQDNLVLSIVSTLGKVPFEITSKLLQKQ